ncbi:uncharacterized protein LOC112342884 isoform X2 [Selaginella moellendorffii]|uniref:uncharacterized protein LOC112342884 isoform X2 n=1 Tax=Selaginella moellendorffii TaxID=88036 RepID=UPI000D1C32CE|nr:uncharacterized protein LOC112342884 isoform X2 [Selaginella moellendorffii]|eukprot:XP_024521234.1 uncharacterized protein LOC112342884 isoform X2 [Selaginella moellendorffii]
MAAAADPLPPPPAAEEEEGEEQQEEGAPYSPALTVESDIDYAAADVQEIAALSPPPSPEPPDDSTTIAFSMPTPAVLVPVEDRPRKKSLEESGEELLAPPWSRSRSINRASSRQPTSPGPSGPRLESYPSFLNSRRSVNMSTCSSPNVFRTLQKSPSRRANLEETYPALDPKVVDTIKELDELRRTCEKKGHYLEANAAVAKLQKLKMVEDEKRRATMLDRHLREREMAKKAYVRELEERNRLWDDKLKNFHREVMEHAGQLKRQHTAALQALRTKLNAKTPSKPQWSGELLRLRKVQVSWICLEPKARPSEVPIYPMQECLGKQGKYIDAQELKRQADQMEQAELQATLQSFQNEVGAKENALRSKQHVELEVLLQRAAQARDDLQRNREQDLERCHQRHKNVVRELKVIHSQEIFRFDHYLGKKAGGDERRQSVRKSVSASSHGRPQLGGEEDTSTHYYASDI